MEGLTTLIPARAGSVRIPHKNVQIVAGKPLVAHALEAAIGEVVVDTDDPQVKSIALNYGATVVDRPSELAGPETSIDDLLRARYLPREGHLVVLQPTVLHRDLPTVIVGLIKEALEAPEKTSLTLATPVRHLFWDGSGTRISPRTDPATPIFQEIGCRFYPEGWSDPSPNRLHQVEGLHDIDTYADMAAAQADLEQKPVIFRVKASDEVGSGHIRRCITLAAALGSCYIRFLFVKPAPQWAKDLVPWQIITQIPKDLLGTVVVNDTLDTDEATMASLKARGAKILSFEDRGPGARYADILINDLYPAGNHPNERTGPDWAILRPEFMPGIGAWAPTDPSLQVLVSFGGTDPARITERACLEFAGMQNQRGMRNMMVRAVTPPGRPHLDREETGIVYLKNPPMAAELAQSDLVITSGGRTVWEAAAVGTPVITVLQNAREQSHSHLKLEYGVINLGLSSLLHYGGIIDAVESVLSHDPHYRTFKEMRANIQGLVDGRGTQRVVNEIERLFLWFG